MSQRDAPAPLVGVLGSAEFLESPVMLRVEEAADQLGNIRSQQAVSPERRARGQQNVSLHLRRPNRSVRQLRSSRFVSSAYTKWRFANALPEPLFKYFSKRMADDSWANSMAATTVQGANSAVYRH